tara:strand:- start:14127 stop:15071 length:945 start_codon:yes stop_codon:yes gene_type:complete
LSKLYKYGKRWYYRRGYHRQSLFTENLAIAKQIKKKLDDKYELESFGIYTPSSRNIHELSLEWIQFIKNDKSESWWNNNLNKINKFVNRFKDRPIASIQPRDLNQYISSLKNGLAPNTVLNYLKPIRQMLQFAVSNGYIDRNPMKSAQLPIAKEKRRFRAISKDILFKIFNDENVELKHRQFWMVCYFTGLDSGDAGTLLKRNIKNNIIQLERNKSDVPVQIPIHSILDFDIINIMPSRNSRGHSSKLLKKELAKYDIYGSIKNLRASFISHLHDIGLSTMDIKVAVGHTSEKMTAHYTTKQLEIVKNNIEQLT